jgi:methyltransferase-like protein
LYHEYLAPLTEPVWFGDFADAARARGLRYLCDAELRTLFPVTVGDAAADLLQRFEDPLEREQYLDFLLSRIFRRSLLCRAAAHPQREPSTDAFKQCALYASLTPPRGLDLRRAKGQPFAAPSGEVREVVHPLTKAAIARLYAAYPDSVALDELAEQARREVRRSGAGAFAGQVEDLVSELFSLYVHGAVHLDLRPQRFYQDLPERPRVTGLALAQSEMGLGYLATVRHEVMQIDAFAARVVSCLDGTRTLPELVRRLVCDIADTRSLDLGQDVPADRSRLTSQVAANCGHLLKSFARHGILQRPSAPA